MHPDYPPAPQAVSNSWPPPAPPITGAPTPPPARGARRRHPGLFWFALLVSAVVFAGAGAVAVLSYLSTPSPSDVVTDYFKALAADDARGALAYGDVPAGDHRYLTDEVLRQQLTIAAIGPAQMLASTQTGTSATVSVHYSLGFANGKRTVSDSVKLVKRSGRWRLASSAVVSDLSVAEAGHRLTFAGTAVPDGPTIVFPGALPVHFDTANLEIEPSEAVVRFADDRDHQLDVELSAAGTQVVKAALDKAIVACLATTSTDPLCPGPTVQSGGRVVPGSLHGGPPTGTSVTTHIAANDDGLISIDGSFDTDGSFTTLDFNNVASVSTSQVSVVFSAQCYAADPSKILWKVPS